MSALSDQPPGNGTLHHGQSALGITIVVLIAILLSQGQSIMARMDAQIRFTSGME